MAGNSDNEVIFIEYDGVIKTPIPFLLKELQKPEYKDGYSDDIDYSKIESMSDRKLLGLAAKRTKKNILEYLAKTEFDYELTLEDLLSRFPDIYSKSRLLTMGQAMYIMLQQKFTQRIYIYSKIYDERIQEDISKIFNRLETITYVSGDFDDVISKIPEQITSYIISDIDYIPKLIAANRVKYTNIILGEYGYNHMIDEDEQVPVLKIKNIEEIAKENIFKLVTFRIDKEMEL